MSRDEGKKEKNSKQATGRHKPVGSSFLLRALDGIAFQRCIFMWALDFAQGQTGVKDSQIKCMVGYS